MKNAVMKRIIWSKKTCFLKWKNVEKGKKIEKWNKSVCAFAAQVPVVPNWCSPMLGQLVHFPCMCSHPMKLNAQVILDFVAATVAFLPANEEHTHKNTNTSFDEQKSGSQSMNHHTNIKRYAPVPRYVHSFRWSIAHELASVGKEPLVFVMLVGLTDLVNVEFPFLSVVVVVLDSVIYHHYSPEMRCYETQSTFVEMQTNEKRTLSRCNAKKSN